MSPFRNALDDYLDTTRGYEDELLYPELYEDEIEYEENCE